MSQALDTASVLQNPSIAACVAQAVHRPLKVAEDRKGGDDGWDRKEIGRPLAATSGNSVSCPRKVDSIRPVGSPPEPSWKCALSWWISPRI